MNLAIKVPREATQELPHLKANENDTYAELLTLPKAAVWK